MISFKPILFLILLFAGLSNAQNINYSYSEDPNSSISPTNIFYSDLNQSVDDLLHTVARPTNFEFADWAVAGAIVLSTGLFINNDEYIKSVIERNPPGDLDPIFKIGEFYGSGVSALLFPAGLYAAGLITENADIRGTGRMLFESLLISGMVVATIKVVAGRSRPYLENGAKNFDPFNFDNDYESFPSGHTVIAFTISSVLAAKIKNTYAGIGLYSLAALTAYQRLYSKNHWFSDTFLAAALGIVIGNTIVKFNEQPENSKGSGSTLSFTPYVNYRSGVGLNFSLNF